MAQEIQPPEAVLEQLYQTGREWMRARAHERRFGPPSDWGRGDNPPRWEEPHLENRAAADAQALRRRFRSLVDEFIQRVEEQ
ncbi:MAG TPA: hypothetical protein VF158_01555 [Longimicrobiales bacterium]